jgi:hypothetical protein
MSMHESMGTSAYDAQSYGTAPYDSSTVLADQVADGIERVRSAGTADCGRRRDDVLRLVHRWAAQQDRSDVTRTARVLDGWAAQLNAASRSSGSAGPVVRIGLRLRKP